MGTKRPVIKAHGSSDEKAIFNAVRQAKKFTQGNVINAMQKELEALKQKEKANIEQ